MAVENPKFGKGIPLAGGFDLGAKAPLDSRDTVKTIEERDLHVTGNRAYEGMLVYVEEDQVTYQYTVVGQDESGNNILGWKEFGISEEAFNELFDSSIEDIEGRVGDIEKDLAKGGSIENRISALEGLVVGGEGEGLESIIEDVSSNKAAIDKLNGDVQVEGSVANLINVEKERAEGQEAAIRKELADAIGQYPVEANPEEGVEAVEGSGLKGEMAGVVDQLQNAMGQLEEDLVNKDDELQSRVSLLVGLNVGKNDTDILAEGSIIEKAIGQSEQNAKDYADQQITALVDSAPDAMNTLNELATAIKGNKDIYDGYVEQHAQAMTNLKTELQGEIDADVKVVSDELGKQKDAAQEGTLAHQIASEASRAAAAEQALENKIDSFTIFTAYDGDKEYDDLTLLS